MADVNIEKIVIGFLEANKDTGWFIYGDMPKTRPDKFVLVDRTGGPRDFIVQDRAEILIEVYHKDSRVDASDEANRIADIIKNLEVLEPVMRAKVTSLVKLDDLIGQYWRYQLYCDVFYRRDVSSDVVYPVIPSGSPVTSVNGKIGAVVLNAADVGAVASVVAGTNVTVDNTDPQNPVINVPDAGLVDSVNGETGDVVLDADDIDDSSTTNKFVTAADKTNLSNLSGVNTGDQDISGIATNASNLADHENDTSNPHSVTKAQVGLGNADNTSDANKPVSTAQQAALDDKQDILAEGAFVDGDKTKLDGIESGADVTDSTNVNAAGATMNSDTTLAGNGYFLDEDNMASNDATKVPSQQSVKAYVDAVPDGDVVGPVSSTDNAIPKFDGATGKIIQNSGVTIDDTTNVINSVGGLLSNHGAGGEVQISSLFGYSIIALWGDATDAEIEFAFVSSGLAAALGFSSAVIVWGAGGSTPFDTFLEREGATEIAVKSAPTVYGNMTTAMLKKNAGNPEGSVTAGVGAICNDTTNGNLYLKASGTGNTGWVKLSRADQQDPRQFTSGSWHNQAINALANGTVGGVANRIQVAPLMFHENVTIDQWGVEVTANVASAQGRIVLYDSDGTDGSPNTLLDSSGDLDFGTATGVITEANSFTFQAGHLYWLGVHHSSTATLRAIAIGATPNLGQPSTFGNNTIRNHYRGAGTYASGAPNPIGSISLQTVVIPQVGLRVA